MKFARHTLLASLLATLFLVVACGNKDDVAPRASAPVPAAESGGTSGGAAASAGGQARNAVAAVVTPATAQAATPAMAQAAAATAGVPAPLAPPAPAGSPASGAPGDAPRLKVGFAFSGGLGDGGRVSVHDRARKEMEVALGGKVKTSYLENVPEGAEAEPLLRTLVAQGNEVIFGTSPAHMDAMIALAKEIPEVRWEAAGLVKPAANLRTYDVRAYQGAYLAGIIAGKMTRTDTLGFIASVPAPQVVRNINAFTLGAQSVNPSVRTKVVWINKWLDAGRESEAAQALINGGADVLLQNTDSSAPLQVAEKAGKYAFGWNSDMKAHGPKSHLGSVIVNLAPYYTTTVEQVLAGKWKADTIRLGLKDGAVDLVSLSDVVPEDVRALVVEKKKAIADGSFRIWKGPLLTSEDEEILATGAIGDEKFIGAMTFYVKGVEGKIPSGN